MRRLVLIGGGHAHLFVLSALSLRRIRDVEVELVSLDARHHYSGMVPGFLHGAYAEAELSFDVEQLCARAGVRFTKAAVASIDGAARTLSVNGTSLSFDAVSVDAGSAATTRGIPGAQEFAIGVRPMSRAIELAARADALATPGADVPIAIAGAGAAGVEVALALVARLRAHGARPSARLIEASPRILAGEPPRLAALAERALAAAGIAIVTRTRVASVEKDAVVLDSGARLPSALTVWLAGAAPPAFFADSKIPLASGWLSVDETLRAVDGTPVFGAGDCISIRGHESTPRAGVYAVREGPILAGNLRAFFEGTPLTRYLPQRSFLKLMDTADGRALLLWRGISLHARAAMRLKRRIDRRFVRSFRADRSAS